MARLFWMGLNGLENANLGLVALVSVASPQKAGSGCAGMWASATASIAINLHPYQWSPLACIPSKTTTTARLIATPKLPVEAEYDNLEGHCESSRS